MMGGLRGNVGLLHGAIRRKEGKRNTGDMCGAVWMVWIALDGFCVWLID